METLADTPLEPHKCMRIVAHLLEWYARNQRALPWRGASAYGVWVSEIMLQQTQAATVIPYYLRFMEQFPTVQTLAEAPLEEVLKLWAGLGYYARARNLHKAAQIVVQRYGGELPQEKGALEALPGIGPYTAGAIRSIAFRQPHPLVDTNVARVLSRLFGVRGNAQSAATKAQLWRLAQQLVPTEEPGTFNQALMELGSLVCIPSDPRCEQCPLLEHCVAGHSSDPTAFPYLPTGRRSVPVNHCCVLIPDTEGRFLLVQRPPHGLWGGLWEFPRVVCEPKEKAELAALRAAKEVARLEVQLSKLLTRIKHGVMHYRITLYAYLTEPISPSPLQNQPNLKWVPMEAIPGYAMASPQAQVREALRNHLIGQTPLQTCLQIAFKFEKHT